MKGKIINDFILKNRLGLGGMAEVWYAENAAGLKVAVKILSDELSRNPKMRERFLNEANVIIHLNHPNIRKVLGIGSIEGRPAIIMEYLDGSDLKERMRRGQHFTDEELKRWWNQLVSALNYTHAQNIVHRDIKPSNIFIDQNGDVKLLDFGIAKVIDTTSGTLTGSVLGTRIYMSPEQVKDPKRVGPKSDEYSLAVSFVHLLSGKAPYDNKTTSDYDIQVSIVNKPLDLSHLPKEWQGFLALYLKKEPEKRVTLRPFEAVTLSLSPEYDELTQADSYTPKPAKNKKWLWMGLSAIAVVILASLFFFLNSNKTIVPDDFMHQSDHDNPIESEQIDVLPLQVVVESKVEDQLPLSSINLALFDHGKLSFYSTGNQQSISVDKEIDSVLNGVFVNDKFYYCVAKEGEVYLKYIDLNVGLEPVMVTCWGLKVSDCITETFHEFSPLIYAPKKNLLGIFHDFTWDYYYFDKTKVYSLTSGLMREWSWEKEGSLREKSDNESFNLDNFINDNEQLYYKNEHNTICLSNQLNVELYANEYDVEEIEFHTISVSPTGNMVLFGAQLVAFDFIHGPLCLASLDGSYQSILEDTDIAGTTTEWLNDGSLIYVGTEPRPENDPEFDAKRNYTKPCIRIVYPNHQMAVLSHANNFVAK